MYSTMFLFLFWGPFSFPSLCCFSAAQKSERSICCSWSFALPMLSHWTPIWAHYFPIKACWQMVQIIFVWFHLFTNYSLRDYGWDVGNWRQIQLVILLCSAPNCCALERWCGNMQSPWTDMWGIEVMQVLTPSIPYNPSSSSQNKPVCTFISFLIPATCVCLKPIIISHLTPYYHCRTNIENRLILWI